MKIQPRIRGQHRIPRNAAVQREIDQALRSVAREFGVSKAWVISVALADFFKIKIKRFD